MSTEGTGAAAVVVGVAVGGVAVLAAGAVIGAGILAYQGIMWCGKKMEENVEKARNEWINLRQAAYAESRANIVDMPTFIAGQAERIAAASANLTLNAMPTVTTQAASTAQKQLDETLARVRAALENAHDTAQIKAEADRELLTYRLKSEIEAARGLLPSDKIALAEAALQGTQESMHDALHALQVAWQAVSDAQALNAHQERKTRQLIRAVTAQLSSIDSMLRTAARAHTSAYTQQKQEIEAKIENAQNIIDSDLSGALALAEDAQQAARTLMRAVSADTFNQWDQTRRSIVSSQGTLETLMSMINEAVAIKLVEDEQRTKDISRRLSAAQSEAKALLQSPSAASQQQLVVLEERVKLLKAEVFRVVKTRQQRQIAQTVATTLGELGFQSEPSGQPVVQENGDMVRIVATRSGGTEGFKRDDKVVSFDISREGNLSYDFSGYIGDTCLSEAKEIFAALRAKGIFILDNEAMEKLHRIPTENLTVDTLSQTRFGPHLVRNKAQAELAERLREAFARMNFANIQESVIGGCIDFEAFNGSIGYHVILPPDGSAQVFKNHTDVSAKKEDVIVDELSHAREELPRKVKEEKKAKSVETWQEHMETRQQEMLDY